MPFQVYSELRLCKTLDTKIKGPAKGTKNLISQILLNVRNMCKGKTHQEIKTLYKKSLQNFPEKEETSSLPNLNIEHIYTLQKANT
jgi:hypothetical protein